MQVKNAMFEYGRHLGLAFQIVDDILDFTTHAELLGKPQVNILEYAHRKSVIACLKRCCKGKVGSPLPAREPREQLSLYLPSLVVLHVQ